jgi:hypothetical protein
MPSSANTCQAGPTLARLILRSSGLCVEFCQWSAARALRAKLEHRHPGPRPPHAEPRGPGCGREHSANRTKGPPCCSRMLGEPSRAARPPVARARRTDPPPLPSVASARHAELPDPTSGRDTSTRRPPQPPPRSPELGTPSFAPHMPGPKYGAPSLTTHTPVPRARHAEFRAPHAGPKTRRAEVGAGVPGPTARRAEVRAVVLRRRGAARPRAVACWAGRACRRSRPWQRRSRRCSCDLRRRTGARRRRA